MTEVASRTDRRATAYAAAMQLRGLAVVSLSAMTLTLAACGGDGGGDPSCAAVGVGARGYDVLAYDLAARFD